MQWKELEQRLDSGLRGPLPGTEGQRLLSPRPRLGWKPGQFPEDSRVGAGLLLLYPIRDVAHLMLTVRGMDLPQHPGQVSLPGGAVDEGETIHQAALREAREEVALDGSRVRIAGSLSPLHIPVSRFVLHPVVGVVAGRPDVHPSPREVARILEVSLEELAHPSSHGVETRTFRGTEYDVPYLEVDGEKVWGATAMVLAEFLTLVGYRLPDVDPKDSR